MTPSFISITDFTHPAQVDQMLEVLCSVPNRSPHLLGVGVMMSYKTLTGISSIWDTVFPRNEKVAEIFASGKERFNVLHYADYRGVDLLESLQRATGYGGEHLHAIQLDMTWPDPEELIAFRNEFPEIKLILQIGDKAWLHVGDTIKVVLERLNLYQETVDAVLMDRSMGYGRPFKPEEMVRNIASVKEAFPGLSIVFGGGLGPATFSIAEPVVAKFPDSSCDAQRRLHVGEDIFQPVDWQKAAAYLKGMTEMYSRAWLSSVEG